MTTNLLNLFHSQKEIVPIINDEDFLHFFNKVDDSGITNRMMNELDVRIDNKNYYKELYNKIKHFISREKERFRANYEATFFDDKPMFESKWLFNSVILLGVPFVETAKRDKFKIWFTTKYKALTDNDTVNFVTNIEFPYADTDKFLEDNAFVVMTCTGIDDARKVKSQINGKEILKGKFGTALLLGEFLTLLGQQDIIIDDKSWEKETLEELLIIRNKDSFQQYCFHYLKKIAEPVSNSFQVRNVASLQWSPSGTFLIHNTGNSVELISGGKELSKSITFPENCQRTICSGNERYLITFLGLGNSNLISDTGYLKEIITRQNVFIWDIYSTDLIRSIKISNNEDFSNFTFSHDSKYLARLKGTVLIIYEGPEFAMLYDTQVKKNHPLTDGVHSYQWFPHANYLIVINENRKHKNVDTTVDFFQIPSRVKCNLSIPFTNVQIISMKWHPSNKYLLLLLKTVNTAAWSIRIIEFNLQNFSHKSKNYDIINPVVRVNKEAPVTEKEIDYNSVEVDWMDDGAEILVSAKKRLLIPIYSITDKKFILTDNGFSLTLQMFSFTQKDIKVVPWEESTIVEIKYDSIIVSPNSKHFIVYNKRIENRECYGEAVLYVVDDGGIHNLKRIDFGEKLHSIKFDESGRFFAAELCRISMGKTESSGFRVYYISGELISEIKDDSLREILWRPRHKPYCNIYEEMQTNLNKESQQKQLEDEDIEFLSDFDKQKKMKYNSDKKKIYDVIDRRRKQWEASTSDRNHLMSQVDLSEVECYVYKEEVIKFEEKVIKK